MVFRFGVNNWGRLFENQSANYVGFTLPTQVQPVTGFLICTLIFIEYKRIEKSRLMKGFLYSFLVS
ncbi:Uncharacterised protein [Streptococcus pneumoniae]|nr:Uncharacterised protein [Streptococcus pneumoniae]CWL12114.1 Uncharacterised protein [Streptococcus pneumoniae]VLL72881.1 Uncharacterised protein [Streptococcus pneumoniae]